MYDHAHGGNDTLIGGDGAIFNFFLGDASDMYDSSRGGNDTLIGGANTDNELFGDAFTMHGNARGGNDTLIGGANSTNNFYGDAFSMVDTAAAARHADRRRQFAQHPLWRRLRDARQRPRRQRHADRGRWSVGQQPPALYGDANSMVDNAHGGNDMLIGGDGSTNNLYGDAFSMSGNAHGGNDTLIGGAGIGSLASTMTLYGDASEMHDNARGGNDQLTGGAGGENISSRRRRRHGWRHQRRQ